MQLSAIAFCVATFSVFLRHVTDVYTSSVPKGNPLKPVKLNQADRKCFVATAAAPAPQNCGTICVSGVPPVRQNVSSGAARYPGFRPDEISLLFRSRAGFAEG